MKRAQIKELSESIIGAGELSDKDLQHVFSMFSRKDLKQFMLLLSREIKDKNVSANFAGELSEEKKKEIISMFPGRKVNFIRDDAGLIAGLRFEYGDFVLDYSVSGIIKRTLENLSV
ncbi:MAG: F0F1 ATP synthase subunit delta [Endomicrobia bacterium]|nr:F0F1 ATP synthase subunit delta [Endomicrobiia bacterium]MCL2506546.1 F0F1 ATP synthase subunit delta [Endomicrobiia bacterium]